MALKPRQERLIEQLREREGNARVVAVELSPLARGRHAFAALCCGNWNACIANLYFAMTTTCTCIAKRLAGANRN